jgi:hypothetical protein
MLNVIILNVVMQIVVAPFDLAGLLETDLHLSPEKKNFFSPPPPFVNDQLKYLLKKIRTETDMFPVDKSY